MEVTKMEAYASMQLLITVCMYAIAAMLFCLFLWLVLGKM